MDLPTPPLQLETAITSATFASAENRAARALRGRGVVISKSADLTHGSALTLRFASSRH